MSKEKSKSGKSKTKEGKTKDHKTKEGKAKESKAAKELKTKGSKDSKTKEPKTKEHKTKEPKPKEAKPKEEKRGSKSDPLRNHKEPLPMNQTMPNLKNIRTVEDDLKCPICLELPVDPVMAEDGRIYEREYIYRYFMSCSSGDDDMVKSPITNERISKRLVSAHQIKSHIETLIMYGMIRGDIARKWQAKALQQSWKDEAMTAGNQGRTVETMQSLTAKIDDLMASLEMSNRDDGSWVSAGKKPVPVFQSDKGSEGEGSKGASKEGESKGSKGGSRGSKGEGSGDDAGTISSLGQESVDSGDSNAQSVNTHALINHLLRPKDGKPTVEIYRPRPKEEAKPKETTTTTTSTHQRHSSFGSKASDSPSSKRKSSSLLSGFFSDDNSKGDELDESKNSGTSFKSTGLATLLEKYFPVHDK